MFRLLQGSQTQMRSQILPLLRTVVGHRELLSRHHHVSSFFWQPAATRAGSEPSCKYLFPSVTGNAYRCESIQYVIRDPLAIRRTTKASRPASGPPSLKLEGWPGYAEYRSQCARTQILSPKKDSITGITRELRMCCLPNSRPSSVPNTKSLFSISRTPSPTTESFKLKKPRPCSERHSFASSSENAVDAIYGCGMSLDQNLAVVEKDEIRLYSSGGSSFIHVMRLQITGKSRGCVPDRGVRRWGRSTQGFK